MRPPPSLFRHLIAWALGSLLLVWAAFVFFAYRTGVHEADELTDGHLASVASLLLTQNVTSFGAAPTAAALGGASKLRAHDYQQSLSVFIWDREGKLVARTGEAPEPAARPHEGFETLPIGQPPVPWRAFSRWDGPGRERSITVMLSLAERDGLAQDIAEQVLEPGLWLLPVVALFLVLAIRRGLRPLDDLRRQVEAMDIHREALKAPPHQEFAGIVHAILTLVQRYNLALERERALASEVAHELRTPLASITLNAGTLEASQDPGDRSKAVQRIRDDAGRAAAVITDLLALARASRTELAEAAAPVDLVALARGVVAEYGEKSWQSGHQLSLSAPDACTVIGHPVLLQIALRNLIENALRHTPRGTQVEVMVESGPPALAVRDNGHALGASGGQDAAAPSGLRLGHQVIAKIAAIHDGRFEAEDSPRCYRIALGPMP